MAEKTKKTENESMLKILARIFEKKYCFWGQLLENPMLNRQIPQEKKSILAFEPKPKLWAAHNTDTPSSTRQLLLPFHMVRISVSRISLLYALGIYSFLTCALRLQIDFLTNSYPSQSVTLHTTLGDLKLEIFCEQVPLAAYVRSSNLFNLQEISPFSPLILLFIFTFIFIFSLFWIGIKLCYFYRYNL